MNNDELRHQLYSEVIEMRERGLLDRNGGSLSLRSDDDRVFITPTRAAFRRWQISEDEIVATDMNGERIDDSPGHAAAGGTFFLQLYKQFPLARAIAHSHCSYCLLFASAGAAVPQTTTASDVLGEVPCIIPSESDIDIKSRVVTQPSKVRIPSALRRHRVALGLLGIRIATKRMT